MTDKTQYLIFDWETRSHVDLKKSGAYVYAKDPTSEILCVAYRLGTRETLRQVKTRAFSPLLGPVGQAPEYGDFITALLDPEVMLTAHNAYFERVITEHVFAGRLLGNHRNLAAAISKPSRWLCTASLAAALALPRSLEGAGSALGLKVQKDMDGRKLLLKMCKPRKATKTRAVGWHETPDDLAKLMAYCVRDVDVETELFLRLPPLNTTERKVWELDQTINLRGFEVDRDLVATVLDLVAEESVALDAETATLTGGTVRTTKQRDATLEFLQSESVFLPDLTAKTVDDALAEGVATGKAKRLLEIRQSMSKSSTAKFEAFERRSIGDGRCRDNLLYHGASTGRFAGQGVQIQNLPRPHIKDTNQAAEIIREGDLELVRLLYGNPMAVFSSCARSVIVAPKGKTFYCADYASIEVRTLFWAANHEAGLRAFYKNAPMYEEMAASIYGIDVGSVNHTQRQLGKKVVLGSGYGLGFRKFHQSCRDDGLEISEDVARASIDTYRRVHSPVVKLWSNLERAAIAATLNPGKRYTINRTAWFVSGKFLYCELPSGRRLAYYGPEVKQELPKWGGDEKRPVLYHWGSNPTTKQWEFSGTYGGRLTENVASAIARDLMAEAMLRVETKGYQVVLSVHDELLAECDEGKGSVEGFENLMSELPPWAKGLPVKAAGWSGGRYKKG